MPPDFDALWDYQRPAESERAFRDVLATAGDSAAACYRAQLLTQIARAQGLQRRFDDAHATLDQAHALLAAPGIDLARTRYLLERGRLLNSAGRRADARPLFEQAWEAARAIGRDDYAVDAAHMIAIVASPAEALAWSHRALALAEASPQPAAQRWCGSLCNNIGWTLHAQGQYAAALEMFEAALRHRVAAGKPQDIHAARWCVARCLRSLGRVEPALAILRDIEAQPAEDGEPGYTYEEIGECLLALGQADAARPYFVRAHERLAQNEWLVEGEPARLERLRRLGAAAPT